MYTIIDLRAQKPLIERAAQWFHSKWGVPLEAYLQSMNDALTTDSGVPAWYVVLNEREEIIAGLGVIENDFHKRPDLRPNICAVYVEEAYRRQGIGKRLFSAICGAARALGAEKLYISAHSSKESQAAYRALGCVNAQEIDAAHAAAEPYDVQMEYDLKEESSHE